MLCYRHDGQRVMKKIFYVQETIGGWRQNPIFEGSYEECKRYMEENFLYQRQTAYNIVSEEELEVDYL